MHRLLRSSPIGANLIVSAALFGLIMVADGANGHSGTADEQEACTPDVFRLCSADIPSESRIVACLNRNVARLSPACRSVIDKPDGSDKGRSKR